MKKSIILVYILFIFSGLFAADPGEGKYEEYIVIKYLINERNFKKAETLIDAYLKKYPDDPFILTEKAYLLADIRNDPKEAVRLLEKSGESYPGYYYANYLHARILFSEYYEGGEKDRESVDKAVEYLKLSTEDNGNFYSSYFLLGVIFSETDQFEESNEYFELANRVRETPEAYFNMSANYHKLDDREGEILAHKKILKFSPDNSHILNILSQLYLKKSDFENAAVYLEKLSLLDPGNKKLSFKYLYTLFAAGENEKFLKISDGIDISDSSLLTYARAFILCTKERYAGAEKLLARMQNKDLKSQLLLADIYNRKQDYYRGYRVLKKIAEKDRDTIYYSLLLQILPGLNMNREITGVYESLKDNEKILKNFTLNECYNIIFAFVNLNETAKSLLSARTFYRISNEKPDELKEVIQLFEDFANSEDIEVEKISFEPNFFLILNLYKNRGKYDSAISLINRLIKNGEDEAYYIELCEVYLQQEKNEEAEKLLEWLMEKYPSSVLVGNYYAYYLALQNRDLELALKLSAYTLKQDGESPAYLDTYGLILFKSGRTDEAIIYLKKAYKKNPFEPEIIEHVADYYRGKGDFKTIIDIYKKAIANGVDFKEQLIEKIKRVERSIKSKNK
jgi:tetratricopeptide (TPR) repeat protein